ncbi:DNA polymerase epsilon subunit 3 isoform X5 [Chelonia mydas]|uniref:DNA polymerase epsilon subunit 3 isoform X5 n=1 Tax=Chelonia mydas TaxID=8469 RepID=UPI001CA8B069|nr:DNA polymerase epsilon subunit 3 isoform X5 [Chelonia mydas]
MHRTKTKKSRESMFSLFCRDNRNKECSRYSEMAERPEDLNLPNAVITRIIKEALPDGVNISKEARSAISRAASVFVLYATSCANNFAVKGKRKTLNAGDVLSAMEEMEFQRFIAPLKESLEEEVVCSA